MSIMAYKQDLFTHRVKITYKTHPTDNACNADCIAQKWACSIFVANNWPSTINASARCCYAV